jgi:phosphomannomutase
VKVYLGEIGWVMVRASGTEPMLRVYSETTRPETTRQILKAVASFVQEL